MPRRDRGWEPVLLAGAVLCLAVLVPACADLRGPASGQVAERWWHPPEARWLRHARAHLAHLFPYLPQQPGYSKRLRAAACLIRQCIRVLAADASVWTDDVWVVDSTPVECGRRPGPDRRPAGPDPDRRQELLRHRVRGGHGQCKDHAAAACRKGEPPRAGSQFFRPLRQVIESVNDTFKGQLDLERHGGQPSCDHSSPTITDRVRR
jgi:hypothetical protein